jgi:phosphonoacetaldehyde hydrolase
MLLRLGLRGMVKRGGIGGKNICAMSTATNNVGWRDWAVQQFGGRRSSASVSATNKREQSLLTDFGPWSYTRVYRAPLQAAILDWSGTVSDIYVIAPARAFVEVFEAFGVPISMAEARVPMGLHKRLHIQALLQMPEIAARWEKIKGRQPDLEKNTNEMFRVFTEKQLKCLPEYTGLIPGTAETVHTLRNKYNLKIGSTTGFTRPMVDVLAADAKEQGFVADTTVAGCEVSKPRPYPYMVFQNLMNLGILNVSAVLKADDTASGVGEGLNAGTWTCGLSHTSNYMNINKVNHGLNSAEFEARGQRSRDILVACGAHYVVRDITYLPSVVADINRRLRNGERP